MLMLQFLRDTFETFSLRARYQRLIHEQLLELTEHASQPAEVEEPNGWQLAGGGLRIASEPQRTDLRQRARRLAQFNPHARNILRLLQAYVTGPGLRFSHHARYEDDVLADELLLDAKRLWEEFCRVNARNYSYAEHARRAWRDGECFIRKFTTEEWPPRVRYIDPELIAASPLYPESQGIVTSPHDAETPIEYLKIDPQRAVLDEAIPASDILHTRLGTDSNEKRGVSIFASILDMLDCYNKWVEGELLARKLQSSIVLWRKVQGSPQQASSLADAAAGGSPSGNAGRRERVQPGTILTTNHGTDIQFLHPNTNFGDAVPLGRMLLLSVAAGAGLPEFMLTSDASNGNFASTMVAEGPAVKMFESEQQFFANEFAQMWRWVMQDAIAAGLLPDNFFERIEIVWTFPQLINRDRPRERLADVQLIKCGVLSRAEIARRDGVDPDRMTAELACELEEQTE